MKQVFFASDHAGLALKMAMLESIKTIGIKDFKDLGTFKDESVDYPDYADAVIKELLKTDSPRQLGENAIGILICGSGQGMAIRANRHPHVRAALCWNEEVAKLSREHNNANVLCLPGRLISAQEAMRILDVFVITKFAEGRHTTRVEKIDAPLVRG